jgi:SAM-dependent MidA family methyltransferase
MSASVGFDVFMEDALYGADGFYRRRGGAGRRGADFITSVEVGPLFGAVFANALDTWWEELGRPDPYVVIEGGAGRGALRDGILAAAKSPIAYVAVEFDDPWPERADVVIANELLDNLPFKIAERVEDGWVEVLVTDHGYELGAPIDHETLPGAPSSVVGTRLPFHTHAIAWVARARATARRVALVDYGTRTTAELVGREWLRTYREHGRGGDPLVDPGSQDITCDVAFDQLAPDRLTSQADWLRAHSIDALVDSARQTWTERASIGDLEALKARSRVTEADALLDPEGLGAFLVAEWLR